MRDFFRSDTFKGIRDTIGAILVSAMFISGLIFVCNTVTVSAKADTPTTLTVPSEFPYSPGTARSVDYDYIRIGGTTYILFRDRLTGSISVVPKL